LEIKFDERKNTKRGKLGYQGESTHAIFSEGERQGSSSSSSLSSLFSLSSNPSSPEKLNDDEVNMSGTGRMDGLRLPALGRELFFGSLQKYQMTLTPSLTRNLGAEEMRVIVLRYVKVVSHALV
jgi:hypothetical protein